MPAKGDKQFTYLSVIATCLFPRKTPIIHSVIGVILEPT